MQAAVERLKVTEVTISLGLAARLLREIKTDIETAEINDYPTDLKENLQDMESELRQAILKAQYEAIEETIRKAPPKPKAPPPPPSTRCKEPI